ncbi:MAG: D-alanyl-D-alanine carboxypeptidase/D-alanyl-D-alanine endopeptidase [Ilyomonas sp.]
MIFFYQNITARKWIINLYYLFFITGFSIVFSACSIQSKISKQANNLLIKNPDLLSANVGICIYDPQKNKYLYQHNSKKYFVPASNTKIMTCYAAMRYLGDSLVGARVATKGNDIILLPTGDPTLLHPDFAESPVINYLRSIDHSKNIILNDNNFQDEIYGEGWSWDDYMEDYMQERSALPIYANMVTFSGTKAHYNVYPAVKAHIETDSTFPADAYLGKVTRALGTNNYRLIFNTKKDTSLSIPFSTANGESNAALLADVLKSKVTRVHILPAETTLQYTVIKSQPTDTLLKIMMHRSDNFFAEQTLFMVSNEKLGVMNDAMIIQTLLETDYKDIPQKPRWVDGSGLSRFNLFTPQDFVYVLNKIKNEFSWQRITTIFATSGSGTMSNYDPATKDRIYAKTGTLSNNAALSGYVITNKGRTLIFSCLVGNHTTSASEIRKNIVKILRNLIEKY